MRMGESILQLATACNAWSLFMVVFTKRNNELRAVLHSRRLGILEDRFVLSMPRKKDNPPPFPDDAALANEILAPLGHVRRKAIAEAAGIPEPTLSKIRSGQQQLTRKLESKLVAVVRALGPGGFAEPEAAYQSQTNQQTDAIPLFICSAFTNGEWRIDLTSQNDQRLISSLAHRATGLLAFNAPDNSAAPRIKKNELVILARDETPGVGDDAFLSRRGFPQELRGFFGELLRGDDASFSLRQYCAPTAPLRLEMENWEVFSAVRIS